MRHLYAYPLSSSEGGRGLRLVGQCDGGGELTAFTPHRTTVSPECTRAEPSAVDMEPGGETTHTISIALSLSV